MKKLAITLLVIFLSGVGMVCVQNIGHPPNVYYFLIWKLETIYPVRIFALIFIVMVVSYFIPTVVAYKRNKVSKGSVLILNLFLGWTFVGWVASLVWAMKTDLVDLKKGVK